MKNDNVPYLAKYLTPVVDDKESVKMSTFETCTVEPTDDDGVVE